MAKSRVGSRVIPIPKGVELKLSGRRVSAKGPKGELSMDLLDGIELEIEGAQATAAPVAPVSTSTLAGAPAATPKPAPTPVPAKIVVTSSTGCARAPSAST